MYNLKLPILMIIAFFFAACSNDAEKSTEETGEPVAKTEGTCPWYYDGSNHKLYWKAFKTTEKIGVKGEFTDVAVQSSVVSSDVKEVLKGLKIKINVGSTSTGDATRDTKIVDFFFKKMIDTDMIEGDVKSVKGTNDSGKIVFNLKMNGVVNDAPMKYTFAGGVVSLVGIIDVNDWKAEEALSSLNEACFDLHKGPDGVSKTWSQVEIYTKAQLKSKCD